MQLLEGGGQGGGEAEGSARLPRRKFPRVGRGAAEEPPRGPAGSWERRREIMKCAGDMGRPLKFLFCFNPLMMSPGPVIRLWTAGFLPMLFCLARLKSVRMGG